MAVEKIPDQRRYQWLLAGSAGIFDGGVAGRAAGRGLGTGRRKALLILLMVLSGLPVCCVSGGVAFSTVYDLARGKPNAFTPRPKVEWDASPGVVILQVARPIHSYDPSLSSDAMRNYIPEGRLFGDGRIVWASYATDGSRTVMVRRLTREQVAALLQRAWMPGSLAGKTPIPPSCRMTTRPPTT